MKLLNSRYCWLLLAAASLVGCGRQERMEAVNLTNALTSKQSNFASANSIEKDFVSSARAWCDGIMTNGGGRGAELDQNAAVAKELAKYAVSISAQLSQVRQALDGQSLQEEYPQHVRDVLTTQLTKRQRMLQDMRTWLEQSAPQFLEFKQSRAYKGDTYPDGVGKMNAALRSYEAPEDVVGAAIGDLRARYGLSAI